MENKRKSVKAKSNEDSIESESVHWFEPVAEPKFRECDILTAGQRKGLQDLKMDIRRENEEYLANHPEINAIVGAFLRKLLTEMPRADFLNRAVEFFTRPEEEMKIDVQNYLNSVKDEKSAPPTDRSLVYQNPFPSVCSTPNVSKERSSPTESSGSRRCEITSLNKSI